MRSFLLISAVYLVASVALTLSLGRSFDAALLTLFEKGAHQLSLLRYGLVVILAAVALATWRFGAPVMLKGVARAALALIGTTIALSAFALTKSNLNFIAAAFADPPFFADPFFAQLDYLIHFNSDPYVWIHALFGSWGPDWVWLFYAGISGVLSLSFITIVAVTDPDKDRAADAYYLWLFMQLVLGNLLALGAMSAGPIYYDQIFEGDRFAPLAEVMQSSGLAASYVGDLQAALWSIFEAGKIFAGSGISAFPSIHVAFAMVVAVYFGSRSVYFIPFGALFVLIILIQSVLTGYHYAVDGYFSIAAIGGFWWWLRKRRTE